MVEFYRLSGDSFRLQRAAAVKVSTLKSRRSTIIFCRRRQRYQLLPFVHDAKHEEKNIHLLLPLVQVMPQSSILKAPPNPKLTGRCKISPLEMSPLRLHMNFSEPSISSITAQWSTTNTSLNISVRHSSTNCNFFPSTDQLVLHFKKVNNFQIF